MYVGVVELLRNLPIYRGIRLTVSTRFREPARTLTPQLPHTSTGKYRLDLSREK